MILQHCVLEFGHAITYSLLESSPKQPLTGRSDMSVGYT